MIDERGRGYGMGGGRRQCGLAVLSTDAAAYLEAKGCEVTAQPTPKSIQAFNAAKKGTSGLFHVTC